MASLLLLCAPTLAWASDPCSTSSAGTLQCDPAATYPQGIHQDIDPATPQDLTLVIGAGYSIETGNDEVHGIAVNNPAGAITISAGNGTISTTGVRAAGIRLTGTGPTGDLTVVAGDVSTSGYRADGISVSTNYGGSGNISISAGNVSTSGEAATGIRAAATHGSIAINAGTISTSGYGGDGLAAETYNGDIGINVGSVSTNGAVGRGIVAYAGGAVTVNAGSVTTNGWAYGTDSDAGGIKAVGSSVRVNAGTVETWGPYSAGIYANSNHVHDAGTTADHDIIVNAGDVRTHGAYSYGIVALNTHDGGKSVINAGAVSSAGAGIVGISRGEGGTVEVTSGSVKTFGDFAYGIAALGTAGVTVSAGSVSTQGAGATGILADANSGTINIEVDSVQTSGIASYGILASNHVVPPPGEPTPFIYGPVSITAGHVKTAGAGSRGIVAQGAGVTVTLTGDILTTGPQAAGIYVDNRNHQQALVTNSGRVVTAGDRSDGIDVTGSGYGNNIVTGAGTIQTLGDYSAGVRVGVNGPVSIDQSSIETRGFYADGVHAVVVSFYGMNLPVSPDLSISVDKVTTLGDYSNGVFAWNQSEGAKTQVKAGQISTTGYHAYGVAAMAAAGSSSAVDVDTVSTKGDRATGIGVEGGAITVTSAGAITTQGAGATGINLFGHGGDIAVDVNAVSTKGEGAVGIMATRLEGDGAITIAAGDIRTASASATGILALGTSGQGDIAIGAGSVATGGDNAAGIQAFSSGGKISIAADQVTTLGQHADGIVATTLAGAIDVKADSVATSGAHGNGVIAVSLTGDAAVAVGKTSTTGEGSIGLYAYSKQGLAQASAGDVSTAGLQSAGIFANGTRAEITTTGKIATTGDYSAGVHGYGASGGVSIVNSGSIATTGQNSYAMVSNGFGPMVLTNSGTITTDGLFGHGVYAIASLPETSSVTIVNSGKITVRGDNAQAIRAIGILSSVNVTSTGTIEANGVESSGILAVADREGRGGSANPQASVTVTAASVITRGDNAPAIQALNYAGGNVIVEAGSVLASGKDSAGIAVRSGGTGTVKAGTVTAAGRGIFVATDQGASVTVTGAITTPNHVAIEVGGGGGDSVINIARGASVTGGGQHIASDGDAYVGRGNTIVMSGAGHNTLNNAGTIIGTGDRFTVNFAETFDAASTGTINNSGLLVGAAKFGDYDDTFNNSGVFEATGGSDFGGGNDLFVNTGVVRLGNLAPAGSKAKIGSTVTLAGLDRFDNRGGLIDLRNGQAGDKLVLPGSYQGSAGARLGLDVAFGAASASDTLVVQGAATGSTAIVLANVDAGRARLTATPITLVAVGAGSAANAFTLDPASSSAGFIEYGLRYDAAAGTFGLTGVAGLPVYRLARASEAAQNIWLRSADAVGGHLTSVRDERWADDTSGRLWGQMQGGVDTRHGDGTRSLAGGGSATFEDGYRQDYYGGQLGFDLARRSGADGGAALGVSAGYMSSRVKASGERLSFDALNGGFYGSIGAGRFFASALAQYDHYWVKAANVGLGYRDQIQGSSWGASAEAGVRLGGDKLFVEPVANLAWTRTSLDDLHAFGQVLDFDRATGLRGKTGLRAGAKTALGAGSMAIFYASGHVVHEFEGEAGLVLRSGGVDAHIANSRLGTYGEGTLGMSVLSAGALSGYVEGVAHLGQSYRGGGARAGLRLKF